MLWQIYIKGNLDVWVQTGSHDYFYFYFSSHEALEVVAFPLQGSSTEQTSPVALYLRWEEHPVESMLPELWSRGLHTGFQPEPSL